MLWLAESALLFTSFFAEALLLPILSASHDIFCAASACAQPATSLLLGACRRSWARFRRQSRYHQMLLATPILWQATRNGMPLVVRLQSWPWWYLSPCLLCFELIVYALSVVCHTPSRYVHAFSRLSTKPILLPYFDIRSRSIRYHTMTKLWLWTLYLRQKRFYRVLRYSHGLRTLFVTSVCLAYVLPARLAWAQMNVERHAVHSFHELEDQLLAGSVDKNTPRFVPDVTRGRVTSVYDGDTLTVAARHDMRGDPYRFSVRIHGIDTPEIRGASASEKHAAIAARDVLRSLVLHEPVSVHVRGLDKYGRLLANIIHDHHGDMSDLLLERGHAVPYDGGKKPQWKADDSWSSSWFGSF